MSKGLRGIEAGTTSICTVGETGDDLHYRGYDVVDLSEHCIFEEVCYLLLHGDLPNKDQLKSFTKKRLGENIFIIRTASGNKYLDESGIGINKLSKDEVSEIVKNNTSLKPYLVEEVTEDKRGSEYRGKKLPIYRAITKNPKDKDINVYVDPYSGEILSIRSKQWRIWDLMWGFLIMDWVDRDNIDNILLKIFSILALISSITELLIFFKVDWSSD